MKCYCVVYLKENFVFVLCLGKYQSSQAPHDDLVDSCRTEAMMNKEGNDTSNKRIYEDTVLLNDTKIKDGDHQPGRGKVTTQTSDTHTSRKSYRKKHKLKYDKKSSYSLHNSNNGETVLSDSDVN